MSGFQVDFFVVGAARSGTTSLYNYLKQHPQVFLPEVKELNYFSKVTSLHPSDYELPEPGESYHMKVIRSAGVYESTFANAAPEQLKGDVSPSYISNTETAARIKEHNPGAKIIMSLRNPVDRAFSHYLMNLAVGYDTNESFEQALAAEKAQAWSGGNRYLEWSMYHDAVASYYRHFPKEQIMVLIFEEWVNNREQTLEELFGFLGVDPGFKADLVQKHNKKVAYKHLKTLNFFRKPGIKRVLESVLPKRTRNKLKQSLFQADEAQVFMETEHEDRLKDYFRKDVEQLERLLDKPLAKTWNIE